MFFIPVLLHASSELSPFRDLTDSFFLSLSSTHLSPLYVMPLRKKSIFAYVEKRKNRERAPISLPPYTPCIWLVDLLRHDYPYPWGDCGLHWFSLDHLLRPHLSCPEESWKKECWISGYYSNRMTLVSDFSDLYGGPAPIISIRTESASPLLQGLYCKLENFPLLSYFFLWPG